MLFGPHHHCTLIIRKYGALAGTLKRAYFIPINLTFLVFRQIQAATGLITFIQNQIKFKGHVWFTFIHIELHHKAIDTWIAYFYHQCICLLDHYCRNMICMDVHIPMFWRTFRGSIYVQDALCSLSPAVVQTR